MKSKILHIILIVVFSLPAIAAGQLTYSGKVIDTRTKAGVSGAEVSVLGSEDKAITDIDGNFSLVTGIDENEPDDSFELTTAPGSILWYSEKHMDIRIVNILGQNTSINYKSLIGNGSLNLMSFTDGIYLLNITIDGKSQTYKFIKSGSFINLNKKSTSNNSGRKSLQGIKQGLSDTILITKAGFYNQKYAIQTSGNSYELLKLTYPSLQYLNKLIRPEAFVQLQGLPLNPSFGEVKSVKVIYSIPDGKVYFANSEMFFIHYYFCRDVLGYSKGHLAFNQEQYTKNINRKYILASINHFTSSDIYTLEFWAGDELDCNDIKKVYSAISATSWIEGDLRFFANATKWDVCSDVPIITSDELYQGQNYQALNPQSNFGYLRKIDTTEIGTTYLGRHDIVLLNSIPLDITVVAGIITTDFQTPLSHINVLSHNRETPNMALRDGWTNPKINNLLDKLVYLNVSLDSFYIREATLAEAQSYWAQREPQIPHILKCDTITKGLINLKSMSVKSVSTIGGKAANFAELTKISSAYYGALPLPEGYFAIPFYYYKQHMKKYGLDIFIDSMLKDQMFLTNSAWRDKQLKILQDSIKKSPLDLNLLNMVKAHLGQDARFTDFRFRSSTNAEDIEDFNGAGLYESYTGSLTNPDKPVDKAIKKVWASLWIYGAFEERDYFKIDHRTIAMGVLVHRSFPAEAANGVVITENLYNPYNPAITVNVQFGEISVVNPAEKYLPDQIICYTFSDENTIEYLNHSNVPGMEGQTVMNDDELKVLKDYCMAIHNHYCALNLACHPMDIEFKVDVINGERKVYIKQARLY
jgi:hypothetical protein